MDEAMRLGFPSVQLTTEIRGSFWDANVYAGLRQFHQAKGFDPDSRDVAQYLAIYQLSTREEENRVPTNPKQEFGRT